MDKLQKPPSPMDRVSNNNRKYYEVGYPYKRKEVRKLGRMRLQTKGRFCSYANFKKHALKHIQKGFFINVSNGVKCRVSTLREYQMVASKVADAKVDNKTTFGFFRAYDKYGKPNPVVIRYNPTINVYVICSLDNTILSVYNLHNQNDKFAMSDFSYRKRRAWREIFGGA